MEIVYRAHGLEVATGEEQVYLEATALLCSLDCFIDQVQIPVPATVDRHLKE